MAVALQWNLDMTSSSALQVMQGLLRAATSDNVQPLALLACERFGATIAMSPDTCRKIETLLLPSRPAVIQFLRATVGYSSDDCATQLGKSLAGVQFLGLATALVSTMDTFKGAQCLAMMLKETASDMTVIPTERQLKELLTALDSRSYASGFADAVIGWTALIGPGQHIRVTRGAIGQTMTPSGWQKYLNYAFVPAPECIARTVSAFRELNRIGEANTTKVVIKSAGCSGWLAAFTSHCLGVPPSLYWDDGTPILAQNDASVELIISRDPRDHRFELFISRSIERLDHLADMSNPGMEFSGMVDVGTYVRGRLQQGNLDRGMARQAVNQALPFAVKDVVAKITFSGITNFEDLSISPLPSSSVVERTCWLVLGLEDENEARLAGLNDTACLGDLPHVAAYMQSLEESCRCSRCESDGSRFVLCSKDAFIHKVACLVADIIAISLFDSVESLKIRFGAITYDDVGTGFSMQIIQALMGKASIPSAISSVFAWALNLVGYQVEDDSAVAFFEKWVLSSAYGQVVYPTIFETYQIQRHGCLSLQCLHGTLRYEGQEYFQAASDQALSRYIGLAPKPWTVVPGRDVLAPCNLFFGFKVTWTVTNQDGSLTVNMGLANNANQSSGSLKLEELESPRNPARLWEVVPTLILLERCEHDSTAPLDQPDPLCQLVIPITPGEFGPAPDPRLAIVAVDGADDLRIFTLISSCNRGDRVVLRKRACLRCCIDICRRSRASLLIL
jgi:hypothetical protein